MLDAEHFRDIVSGRRRGVKAGLVRGLLRAAEAPYTAVVNCRNWRFDRGKSPAIRVDVPVISVGNLTLGGTGKTPMVAWLCRWFRDQGVRVTIVSRGYGAEDGCRNDEARELEQQLPDVPHLQNPDRVAAANIAIEELETELIVLDDGFQHRRIDRDLDIVLIDALEPFGFDHVFPRGTLREPQQCLARAQVVCLTRADMVDADERESIKQQIRKWSPNSQYAELVHQPSSLLSNDGSESDLQTLAGQRIAAFCGIGNPTGFRHSLEGCGFQIAAMREFPDHHNYSRDDVDSLTKWANQQSDINAVVCTHKDLVKISTNRIGRQPLRALAINMHFMHGQADVEAKLHQVRLQVNRPAD